MKNLSKKIHQGSNVKRFRELIGMKQEALAIDLKKLLDDSWDQRKVSLLEDKETIDDSLLETIGSLLNISPEILKNFDSDSLLNIFATNSTYHDNSAAVNFQCTFNPIDKLIEVFEENTKLYEQLLNTEREKIEMLMNVNNKLQKLLEK